MKTLKRTHFKYTLTLLAGLLLVACQQDVDVMLPPYESKLVLECYLEDGQPLRLTLLESQPYLAVSAPMLVSGAIVLLSHQGQTDTIPNLPALDQLTGKSYNYSSPKRIRVNYDAPYMLTVTDKMGRIVTATTHFIRPVAIKSITPEFNDKGKAYGLTKFADNPLEKDYYRLTLTRNRRVDTLSLDALIDNAFSNGKEINWGSGYTFKPGDTLHATLYHCTEAYYKFLSTSHGARQANVNPFSASGEVISNV